MYWYHQAAAQGHAGAQNNLGFGYYRGQGIEQDYTEAVTRYSQAVDGGMVFAQFNLGVCYYNGNGIERDVDEGLRPRLLPSPPPMTPAFVELLRLAPRL